jgi:hypothetical protein
VATLHIPIGAPGIYKMPEERVRALSGVRMDVCAFVGVAPRGPVREPVVNEKWPNDRPMVEPERPRLRTVPVAVESFDEYIRVFGSFEGPGLLPYAVASFFEQGGRRAYVARIVHKYPNPADDLARVATIRVGGCRSSVGDIVLHARNEGLWGNGLTAQLAFQRTPIDFTTATPAAVSFPDDAIVPAGTRLECTLESGVKEIRTIIHVALVGHPEKNEHAQVAALDTPLSDALRTADVMEGVLTVSDDDGRSEIHDHLGLSSQHPRWMGTVLSSESELVFPDATWTGLEIMPAPSKTAALIAPGKDAYEDITPDDFIEPNITLGDDESGEGVLCLKQLPDLSLLVAPDLYSPYPLDPFEPILDPPSLAGPTFVPCVKATAGKKKQLQPVADLAGLRLDPHDPGMLKEIVALQQRVEDFCASTKSFIGLIDVPPGLSPRQILRWRAFFQSAYVACYHPWLKVARRDDLRDVLVSIPPSATAAGLIARSEALFGVPHGPANLLASEIVNVAEVVSPSSHDELHPVGINVYLRERDGVRLSAARTLSRDPAYRQLSVRRLITMISRTLDQQTQWMVFEPNNASLRAEVRALLTGFLRSLGALGAFRGATESESFFVRCDNTINTPADIDAGRVIAEIGVAPSEPIEFIVLRFSRDADGTFTAEQ